MKTLSAIALAMLVAAPSYAQQMPGVQLAPLAADRALLSVSGRGEVRRVPDLAIFTAGVVTQGTSAGEALSENSRRMDSVISALRRAGVAERDIQTASISIEPRYSEIVRQPGQAYVPSDQARSIVGYEARNSVQVKARQLANMGRIIDALVQAGSNQINGPAFTLDNEKSAMNEARSAAVADARAKAEIYARAANMRVVRVVSIAENGGNYPVGQVFARVESFASAPSAPPTPVAPGELTVATDVSAQFELAPAN